MGEPIQGDKGHTYITHTQEGTEVSHSGLVRGLAGKLSSETVSFSPPTITQTQQTETRNTCNMHTEVPPFRWIETATVRRYRMGYKRYTVNQSVAGNC